LRDFGAQDMGDDGFSAPPARPRGCEVIHGTALALAVAMNARLPLGV
jgi:hypothetical protein